MADAGDIVAGRQMLQEMCQQISYTPSARQNDLLCMSLMQEMEEMDAGYANEENYRQWGSKMSKMRMKSHSVQRSTHAGGSAYENVSKRRMKQQMASARATTTPSA